MTKADHPNLEKLLQMGITAAKQGNRDGARMLLRQVLDDDKKNDRAWLWMAYVAEDGLKRRQYLETALKINPYNKAARKALRKITARKSLREQRTLIVGMVFLLLILVVSAFICLVALIGSG